MTQGNVADSVNKMDADNDDSKQKDKSPRTDTSPHADHNPGASGQPAYVPYALYSKLLERVNMKMSLDRFLFQSRHICTETRNIN